MTGSEGYFTGWRMVTRWVGYIIAMIVWSSAAASYGQQTPAYDVISEYIRQLAAIQDVQEASSSDMQASKNQMMDAIRGSTRIKLELSRNVYAFQAMKLDPPFDELLQQVIYFYQKKIELHDEVIEIESKFVTGPEPGVDYGKLAARMPQITANLEYIDKSLYEQTRMFCLLLVDPRPDAKGVLSHFVVTRAQRKGLLSQIDHSFGARFSANNPSYTVSSAAFIKGCLESKHKSADDPW